MAAETIGFVGTGRMGGPMAGRLLDAGAADVLELAMLGHGRSSISLGRPKGTIYVT